MAEEGSVETKSAREQGIARAVESINTLLEGKEYAAPEVQASLDMKRRLRVHNYIRTLEKGFANQNPEVQIGTQNSMNILSAELGGLENTMRQKGFELPGYREAEDKIKQTLSDAVNKNNGLTYQDQINILKTSTSRFELHPEEDLQIG